MKKTSVSPFTKITRQVSHLSEHSHQIVDEFMDHAAASWQRRKDIANVLLKIKEIKQGALFEIHVELTPLRGRRVYIQKAGEYLPELLKQVKISVKEELAGI